jgi:hypothetical protein
MIAGATPPRRAAPAPRPAWRTSGAALALIAAAGLVACAGVLGLRKSGPPAFPHRAHVLAGVACVSCHAGVERAGDDGPLHLPEEATCRGCHKKPHDDGACLGCHTGRYTAGEVAESRAHLRFEHRRHAGASQGKCMQCHVAVQESDSRLRPSMATCFRCHAHEADQTARRCDGCHVDLAEEGTPPESHLVHGDGFLAEHGTRAASAGDLCASCHVERFCAGCHGAAVPALPSRARFDDPWQASTHRAGFRARHAEEARAEPGLCSTCHTEERCIDCHVAQGVAPAASGGGNRAPGLTASPHPPGWLGITPDQNEHGRAARRDPAACASCHGGAGEALCVGCHKVGGVGGNPHPPGWSTRQSRADLPCRLCHPVGR